MKHVVDTNIFNKLVDGSLRPEDLPHGAEFVATHVQVDELNNTSNNERRARLFLKFAELALQLVPTESAVWDTSRWDHAKWGDGVTYQALKNELDAVNGGKVNNVSDALIAEVAMVNKFVLLTSDYHLAEVAKKHGANVVYFAT
jgi:rRNA-processing protein FCF1